jgi:hypothetical protein
MLAKAVFTEMSPNVFPEIDEVYLKYGVFTVVKIHIAKFCVMTPCCSLYQGLGEVHSYVFRLEAPEVTEETRVCIPPINTQATTLQVYCVMTPLTIK